MENLSSIFREFISLGAILLPVGFVNLAFVHYFKNRKLSFAQIISALISPVIIPTVAIFVSQEIVRLMVDSSHGDGLEGFIPVVLLSIILTIAAFHILYKRVFHLRGKQIALSILAMVFTGILSLWFLG